LAILEPMNLEGPTQCVGEREDLRVVACRVG